MTPELDEDSWEDLLTLIEGAIIPAFAERLLGLQRKAMSAPQ